MQAIFRVKTICKCKNEGSREGECTQSGFMAIRHWRSEEALVGLRNAKAVENPPRAGDVQAARDQELPLGTGTT